MTPLVGIDASRAFEARPTGTERYATQLIAALAERAAYPYRLYARAGPPTALSAGDSLPLPLHVEWRTLRAPRLWTHTRLAFELWRRPPGLLFVPAHVLPFAMPPRLRCVVTVHDLGYLAFPETHPRLQRGYLDVTARYHVRRATRLIADSLATRDDLVRRYGADRARIDVVPLGVEPAMRPADGAAVAAAKADLGLSASARYLLCVGTLQPRKNLPRLLAAFARLVADLDRAADELYLVVSGMSGWGGQNLEVEARRLGIAGRVRFAGYVPRLTLAALYTGATALTFPSLYEGFGLPVLEAMACGTPVAASRTSSLPEVVGAAGLLFDPLDPVSISAALERLVREPDLRAALASAGRLRAAEFTWARAAEATEAVFARALAARASA